MREDFLLICCNFTPVVREDYHLGVPHAGWYDEISNSDSEWFGGSNVGNDGGVLATEVESHGRPASIAITLPPLATVVFKPRR